MPLYDLVLMLKPKVERAAMAELISRLGKRVYSLNGVITDIKSFGNVHTAYGIKKLDGRYYQGQMMQMTMMVTPTFPKELEYLNKDDRLLRWLLVKSRNTTYGVDFVSESEAKGSLYSKYTKGSWFEDGDDEYDDDADGYEVEESIEVETKEENKNAS
ncbi:hypothetical protein KI387_003455 [Taxus chinensis]|uniref:Ribosomal protein S6 n=1 Tax=Taxus chinensis TaxID=29808 RepID=A0AA38GYY5_TAXCH|nr:hypothetical protein KI387_003455 [Taxus chinensis]